MLSPFEAVSTYFQVKDGSRPFLMRHVFAEDVQLEMVVKTEAISFPNSARGVAAIEEILGRRFANDFENVYTFCLTRPTEAIGVIFRVIGWSGCRPRITAQSGLEAVGTIGILRPTCGAWSNG